MLAFLSADTLARLHSLTKASHKLIRLQRMSTTELAVAYAALILHDDDVPITGDKISALLKAANVGSCDVW